MLHIVTSEEMRRLDARTIDGIGIPAAVLMENAGRALADAVACIAEGRTLAEAGFTVLGGSSGMRESGRRPSPAGKPWVILAGKGNNGGDGLVAARHLTERGFGVEIVYAVSPAELRGDAVLQRDIAARLGIPSRAYVPGEFDWSAAGGIVDALLGTGSGGAPREPYASLIREANACGLPIVAADLPSGLNADTGEIADPCIRAAATVTFGFLKRGLVQFPGTGYAGETAVAPIGIPGKLAVEEGVGIRCLTPTVLRETLGADPERPREADSHKGTYGHVLAIAGTRAMSGAGLLCCTAALRAGCGLVTWAVPDAVVPSVIGARPELMLDGIADGGRGDWASTDPAELAQRAEERDAAVIGPGLGRFPGDSLWLRRLWESLPPELPVVLDADALNILAEAGDFTAWPERKGPVVLTPHPGEMARLSGVSTRDVQRDRIEAAKRYALSRRVTLVLKGARTVVAGPDGGAYVNTTGNPGMATGGTGDVLAGVIGSLLAGGMPGVAAAALGVYLHGTAGDRAAAKRRSPGSLIAGDLLDEL